MKKESITLKEGTIICGDSFDHNDFLLVKELFQEWKALNSELKSLGGKSLDIPHIIGESLFCLAFNGIRANRTKCLCDCVIRDTAEKVILKSVCNSNSYRTFKSTSNWDWLCLMDFAPNGEIDGLIKFYKINKSTINKAVVNNEKRETSRNTLSRTHIPRISIQKLLIMSRELTPIRVINLNKNDNL